MRRGFARDIHAFCLCAADKVHAFLAGDVADMVGTPRFFCKAQVACDGTPFALGADTFVSVGAGIFTVMNVAAAQEGVVLTVGDNHFTERLGAEHRLAHHGFALHAAAVIRKGDNAGGKCFHIDKFFFSSCALTDDGQILDFSEEETMLRKVLLQHADQSIFLCDSSKLGKNAVFFVANLSQIDQVISDIDIPITE